ITPNFTTYTNGVQRIQGKNRVATAIEVSKNLARSSDVVLVAGAGNFADALSAASLTRATYPLLLLGSDTTAVTNEIVRLGAKKVYILSGTTHITKAQEEALGAIEGVEKVERLAGATRYETNKNILELSKYNNIFVANGENFPDALAAGALCEDQQAKLVLTLANRLPEGLEDLFTEANGRNIYLVGGENSISKDVENKIKSLIPEDAGILRIQGKNRYETAIELSGYAKNKDRFVITNGLDFPDALAAAGIAAKYQMPILLTAPQGLTKEMENYLFEKVFYSALIVGGNNSVSTNIETLLDKLAYPIVSKEGYVDLSVKNIYRYSEKEEQLLNTPAGEKIISTMKKRHIVKVLGVDKDWIKLDNYGKIGWTKLAPFKFYTQESFGKVEFNVPYTSQMDAGAPWGCVPTSLYMGMNHRGYVKGTSIEKFLKNMPRHKSNPEKGFSGSPYTGSKVYKIHIGQNALVKYAQQYSPNVVGLQNATMDDVIREIQNQNPVVLNLTLRWENARFRDYPVEGKKVRYVENNHAALFNGYDPATRTFTATDPYNRTRNYFGNQRGVPGKKLVFKLPRQRIEELFQHDNFAITVR
ncbi:MAG: cell wall-binding repeat-containing protein, partial [Tissierellia bacterium]|nr:cell wall-binding repeat-containing protein [Tissierellia bacterium]